MRYLECTVCPGSSDPFYRASLLYKKGHYFLDIQYDAEVTGQHTIKK